MNFYHTLLDMWLQKLYLSMTWLKLTISLKGGHWWTMIITWLYNKPLHDVFPFVVEDKNLLILCNHWPLVAVAVIITHWGRVMHICGSKLTITGSNNGLSPGRRQAIVWTNDGKLLIWPFRIRFSEISIEINIFSFKKMRLNKSLARCRPFCLGFNVLKG